MMERNEEGTLARFKALQRDLFEPRVSAHYWDYGAWIEEIETALATSAVRKKPARWFPAPSPPEPEQLPPPWPDPARSMQRALNSLSWPTMQAALPENYRPRGSAIAA